MFNLLKNIKPDADKKAAFRNVLLSKMYNDSAQKRVNAESFSFLNLFRAMPKLTASFLAILLVLGSFSGVAFASQSSLPGDTLYDVKLFTEDTRVFLTQDEIEKAILHLKFAQARLNELNNLANAGNVPSDIISSVLENYQNQLERSKTALAITPALNNANFAQALDAATLQNQLTIAILADKFGNSANHIFGEAYEITESVNDDASLVLFSIATSTEDGVNYTATSTNDGIWSSAATSSESLISMIKKSENKIKSAEYKISEVERFINKKSEKYSVDEAKHMLEDAKKALQETKILDAEGKYYESFIKAMNVHTQAQDAKKLAEHANKLIKSESKKDKKDENDDHDDYQYTFFIFPIIASTSSDASVSNTNINDVIQRNATSTDDLLYHHNDDEDEEDVDEEDDDEDKGKEKNRKENEGKSKKD